MRQKWKSFKNAPEASIEKIYNRQFSRYISPKKYEEMTGDGFYSSGYYFEEFRNSKGLNIAMIICRLDEGKFVTSGYMTTDIRDYHVYYLIYKK